MQSIYYISYPQKIPTACAHLTVAMPRSKVRKRKRGTLSSSAVEQVDGDYVLDVGDILDTDEAGSTEFLTKLKL